MTLHFTSMPIKRRTPLKRYTPLKRGGPISRSRTPIKKRSEKRDILDFIYFNILRPIQLRLHPKCQANIAGICTHVATDIHHIKGRGVFYLIIKFFMSLCRNCHNKINDNPEWAEANGFTEKRNVPISELRIYQSIEREFVRKYKNRI